MWILTPSITSAFAAATGASTSASNEQLAAAFARSLLSRSKPSQQRIWLQRLKRDSWTTHLSGAISSDSLGEIFTDWWTSSLAATRANPSAQPASDSAPKTPDTSGLTYQPELLQCDQVAVSLKTSRDISALGYPTLSKTWADWVTERRGAWRARVNAARLIRGKESSSWPTMHMGSNERGAYYDKTGKGQRYLSDAVVDEQKNWPTIRASEYKDVGPVGSKSHDHMLGKHYLCAVVAQEESNGPAAPASSSSGGSRQGLWLTPRANEPDSDPNFAARNADRGAHCHGTLSSQAKESWITPQSGDVTGSTQAAVDMWAKGQRPKTSDQRLRTQVAAMEKRQALWPTITAHTPDMESNGPNGHSGTYLAGAVKQWGSPAANDANKQNVLCEVNSKQAGLAKSVGLELQRQWATPRSGKTTDENPETWALRQAKGDVATMPLTAQVKQWATPRNCGGPDYAKTQRPTSMSNSLSLPTQVAGKLNPRWVETLMGLPIGWTMPSCIRPVTIAPTSCDSSATESCRPLQSERSDFLLLNWPTPNANEIENKNKEYRSPCNAYKGDKKVQPMLCDAVNRYGSQAQPTT